MLVPLQRAPISAELCCEFQRQKYEVTLAAAEPPASLTPAALADEELALLGEWLSCAVIPDAEALAAYKAHPIYQESIDIVRPLRDMRVPADF